MKKLTLMLTMIIVSTATASAVSISPGDNVDVRFNIPDRSLYEPYLPLKLRMDYQVTFTQFGNDPALALNSDESFTVSWYENNDFTNLLQLDTSPYIPFDAYSYGNTIPVDVLTMDTGIFRISNIVGNFDIDKIETRFSLPDGYIGTYVEQPFAVHTPVPAAAWLFGSGLLGLIGIARRK